jgi:hypothetical protein
MESVRRSLSRIQEAQKKRAEEDRMSTDDDQGGGDMIQLEQPNPDLKMLE